MRAGLFRKCVCLLFLGGALGFFISSVDISELLGDFGRKDLIAFWAGTSIFLRGGNPYDPEQLDAFYASLTFDPKFHQIFWNPPWSLSTIGWFGLFPFHVLVLVCLLAGIMSVAASALIIKGDAEAFSRSRASKLLQLILVLSFYPLAFCLGMGQLSAVLLLVLVWAIRGHLFEARMPPYLQVLSGAALSLLLIKPHLFHLIFLLVGMELLRKRRMLSLFGLGACSLAQILLPLLWQPGIYRFYSESAFPTFWFNSSLGALAQSINPESTWLRFVPMILVDVGAMVYWAKLKSFLPAPLLWWCVIVPASVLSAPYAWVYDFVLLLPALQLLIAYAISKGRWHGICTAAALLAANAGLAAGPREMQYYTWFPALILIISILVVGISTKSRSSKV